jgi:uncharacterized protein involved in type VI secretion and phage assembly
MLPPGVAVGTLTLPDFASRIEALKDWLVTEPAVRPGPVYDGRMSATVRGPDGSLFEVVAP